MQLYVTASFLKCTY